LSPTSLLLTRRKGVLALVVWKLIYYEYDQTFLETYITFSFLQFFSLVALLASRMAEVLKLGTPKWWSSTDVATYHAQTHTKLGTHTTDRSMDIQRAPRMSSIEVLMGSSVERAGCMSVHFIFSSLKDLILIFVHDSGESNWSIASRGVAAVFLGFFMGFFTFVSIIREPVQEWDLMPTKELRSRNYQQNIAVHGVKVFIDMNTWEQKSSFKYPVDISVRRVFDGRLRFTNESPVFDSHHLHLEPGITSPYEARQCPLFLRKRDLARLQFVFSCGSEILFWPSELLITVNYTFPGPSYPSPKSSILPVKVRLAYTDDISVVLKYTKPVFLIPGINFVGIGSSHILQRPKNNMLASLGMFEVGHMSVQSHSKTADKLSMYFCSPWSPSMFQRWMCLPHRVPAVPPVPRCLPSQLFCQAQGTSLHPTLYELYRSTKKSRR